MRVPRRSGGADAFGKSLALLICGSLAAVAGVNASEIADAAKRGNVASVRDLAKAADAAALDQPGRDSMTALLWAAQANDIDIARTLLDAGADANLANRYGITPLWLAATNRSPALVKLLLEHGANASAELPHGETALMARSSSHRWTGCRSAWSRPCCPSAAGRRCCSRRARTHPMLRSRSSKWVRTKTSAIRTV
jgi:hypothetical protein